MNTYQNDEPLGGCFMAFLIGIGILFPIIGPLVCIIVGLTSKARSGASAVLIVGITMACLNLCVCVPVYMYMPKAAKEVQKAMGDISQFTGEITGQAIVSGLETYAAGNNGEYPLEIETLVQKGFLADLPINPYMTPMSKMANVPFGSEKYAGNFTYIPIRVNGKIKGYYLLIYGQPDYAGKDVNEDGVPDHVLFLTGKNPDNKYTLKDYLKLTGK